MIKLKRKLNVIMASIIGLSAIFSSCGSETGALNTTLHKPIKKAEIIAFQKAYGVSFNAISEAVENDSYYEAAAEKHINQNYNFDEGKVMFKISNSDGDPYRYKPEGILSYLIGKNSNFPSDIGVAKENWRKIEWKNDGIINDRNGVAIVMGVVKMLKDDNDVLTQNFTMCLARNSKGELKLITHKIALPCR